MPQFRFYLDQKVTVWERETHYVEAETREAAIEKMKARYDDFTAEVEEEPHYETLPDTTDPLIPEQNYGYATRELIHVKDDGSQDTVLLNGTPN